MRRLSLPVGLASIAVLLSAVFVLSLPGRLYWQRVVQDGGHGAVFAGVAIVLLLMRRGDPASGLRTWGDYGFAFLVAVVLGVATEALQRLLPGRQVSGLDVLHDAAGAAFGLALVALVPSRATTGGASPRDRRLAAVVAVAAALLLAVEPVRCAWAYAQRATAYPDLAPTGARAEAAFVAARNASLTRAPLPAPWHLAGEPEALRLDYATGTRPALELAEPAPDWRGHATLALDVTNPAAEPAWFVLRVLDAQHDWRHEDRLNLPVVVAPRTRTTVRIATAAIAAALDTRELDLAAIANVMLFAPRPLHGETFYVSRIWLED